MDHAIAVLEREAYGLRMSVRCDVATLRMSLRYLTGKNPPKKRYKAAAEWAANLAQTRRDLNDVRWALQALRGPAWSRHAPK